jgi:hypothetical protein
MTEEPCETRGVLIEMDLREGYTVAHGNQGNGSANTQAAVKSHSTILNI